MPKQYDAFPRIMEKGFLITQIAPDFCSIYGIGKTEKPLDTTPELDSLIMSKNEPTLADTLDVVPKENARIVSGELFRGILRDPILDIMISRITSTTITHAAAYVCSKGVSDDPIKYIRAALPIFSHFGFTPMKGVVSRELFARIADTHSQEDAFPLYVDAIRISMRRKVPQDKVYGLICSARMVKENENPDLALQRNCKLFDIDSKKLGF